MGLLLLSPATACRSAGRNNLVPADAKLRGEFEVRRETCYSLNRKFLAAMEACRRRFQAWCCWTACRDNPFARSWQTQRRRGLGGGRRCRVPNGTPGDGGLFHRAPARDRRRRRRRQLSLHRTSCVRSDSTDAGPATRDLDAALDAFRPRQSSEVPTGHRPASLAESATPRWTQYYLWTRPADPKPPH